MAGSANRDSAKAARAVRMKRALSLRLQGKSYDAIAAEMKLGHRSSAFRLVADAIEGIPKEEAEQVLAMELERCDAMLVALQPKIEKGNTLAVDAALKIMARRAKYLGLDAPTKQEHSGSVSIDAEELKAAAERVRARIEQATAADPGSPEGGD